jgi:hypothetical protein
LSRDANRLLEPVLDQVVDELRTASPQRVIETNFEITEPVNRDRTRIGTTGVEFDRQCAHAWRAGPASAGGSKNRRRQVQALGHQCRRTHSGGGDGKAFRAFLSGRRSR